MLIRDMQKAAHENAIEKGFCDHALIYGKARAHMGLDKNKLEELKARLIASELMHLSREVSEIYEAVASGDSESLPHELADVAIMLGTICGMLGVDLQTAVIEKLEINKNREPKHGKLF